MRRVPGERRMVRCHLRPHTSTGERGPSGHWLCSCHIRRVYLYIIPELLNIVELISEIWWRICEKTKFNEKTTFENETPGQCKEDWRRDRETLERLCWRQVDSHKDDRLQNQDSKPITTHTPRCRFYTPTWRTWDYFPSIQVSKYRYAVLMEKVSREGQDLHHFA